MRRDSVGPRFKNSLTKFSSNCSLFESFLSWPICSWNFSQILFSELGGGKAISQPCCPNVVLYSSGRLDWWWIQNQNHQWITVFILWQVNISNPLGWALHEHLWTIAICVAGAPNDWVVEMQYWHPVGTGWLSKRVNFLSIYLYSILPLYIPLRRKPHSHCSGCSLGVSESVAGLYINTFNSKTICYCKTIDSYSRS